MAKNDGKLAKSTSQVRDINQPRPQGDGLISIEKGSRVVSQGNVNPTKAPTSSGPVSPPKSDAGKGK